MAAVRDALRLWKVTTVVVPDQPGLPAYEQGRSGAYASGFFTAVLGTLPTYVDSAWVWNDVGAAPAAAPVPGRAFAALYDGTGGRGRRAPGRAGVCAAGVDRHRWRDRCLTPGSGPVPGPRSGRGRALALAAAGYLALALVVWWGVWSDHPTATTTCGCGDSALFLWFFAWPAHALAHGLDPFFSTAMSHPGGVNLLANTSELALGRRARPGDVGLRPGGVDERVVDSWRRRCRPSPCSSCCGAGCRGPRPPSSVGSSTGSRPWCWWRCPTPT